MLSIVFGVSVCVCLKGNFTAW